VGVRISLLDVIDDQQLAVGAGDGECVAVQIEVAHLGVAQVGDCRIASAHLVACPQAPEVIALERAPRRGLPGEGRRHPAPQRRATGRLRPPSRWTQVALAWLLQRSPSTPIPGTSSVAHLRENVAAADLHLPADAVAELDTIGRWGFLSDRAGPRRWRRGVQLPP
jgi:hypothetical protein